MKRVLVEMEKLKNPNSGLGQFCINIGQQFSQLPHPGLELDFYLPSTKNKFFGNEINYVIHSQVHKIIPLSGKNYDVWHCLQQDSHYLPSSKNTKIILTIHDLNFLEKYKGGKQKRKLKSLQKRVNKASAITVISKFTELMVRENLEVGNKPIHVIHNGNSLKHTEHAAKPTQITFDNYIFSIGIVSPRKNFHVLLPLLTANKDLHLVIAGNNNSAYAQSILKAAKQQGVDNRLHLLGEVSDDEKYWLLNNCKAFVFPSLSEGFGLPVIEAMSLGKPVFLANTTSLPEVGGAEAHYFKSFVPEVMIDIFKSGMKNFTPEKAARSIEWTNQFSWKKAAEAYLNLYKSI